MLLQLFALPRCRFVEDKVNLTGSVKFAIFLLPRIARTFRSSDITRIPKRDALGTPCPLSATFSAKFLGKPFYSCLLFYQVFY